MAASTAAVVASSDLHPESGHACRVAQPLTAAKRIKIPTALIDLANFMDLLVVNIVSRNARSNSSTHSVDAVEQNHRRLCSGRRYCQYEGIGRARHQTNRADVAADGGLGERRREMRTPAEEVRLRCFDAPLLFAASGAFRHCGLEDAENFWIIHHRDVEAHEASGRLGDAENIPRRKKHLLIEAFGQFAPKK
jgi:hypothetical protein